MPRRKKKVESGRMTCVVCDALSSSEICPACAEVSVSSEQDLKAQDELNRKETEKRIRKTMHNIRHPVKTRKRISNDISD